MQTSYPSPKGGASLVLSFRLEHKTTLIIGSGSLAASRAFSALEADSKVVVLAKGGLKTACDEIRWRVEHSQVTFVDWDLLPGPSKTDDVEALEGFLDSTPGISFVVITDTILNDDAQRRPGSSAERIYQVCASRNIPVNTTDMPQLCDFSFTSSYRFEDPSGGRTPLQIGVTTNGQGCRLAGRLRREIVAKLPKEAGSAVQNVGKLRALAKSSDSPVCEDCFDDSGVSTPNRPVPQRSLSETAVESARRRMKWVAQVSEYWPLSKLANLTEKDMEQVLSGENQEISAAVTTPSLHSLDIRRPGRILLVGSGPGHPSLLTQATHNALTKLADLVLSDKLVPDAVLALIPSGVEVRIAKKFPGNADGAQNEMMEAAVEAARKGLTVVRLKQGDPVVYGRAGEEVLYFRSHGFEPVVVPGVSSALAGPTFAGIPVTQRGAAESFIVCTGVGRKGKQVRLPGYERGRTLIILMGVARLPEVISTLIDAECARRDGPAYPSHTPIALIERASMPDQRVVDSTLKDIVRALDSVGEQRPPGMLVIGWAVPALWEKGDVEVLEESADLDESRIIRWLGQDSWRVREGLQNEWDGL
ncbi:uroporphyrin-III C-methyltransferase [Armillaria novae-zelandiae]|uniref:precorrin-2 dehydrogenase n=1 Tax=Armillaria novae-zelandiae TaxID=153914 RepID=A0AA39PBU4_9AGAR|nr:uroporphyrin-III C-methyltransferase [Armillaria novae-zelandiae]